MTQNIRTKRVVMPQINGRLFWLVGECSGTMLAETKWILFGW